MDIQTFSSYGFLNDPASIQGSSSESDRPFLTREYAKRNERVIADGGKYANVHSFHSSAVNFLGNSAD